VARSAGAGRAAAGPAGDLADRPREGATDSARLELEHIRLPFLAGIVFGLFFLFCCTRPARKSLFWPIIATRMASITFLLGFATLTRQQWKPQRALWPMIALCGLLDTPGTAFSCLRAARADGRGRRAQLTLPGGDGGAGWLLLRERIARLQVVGIFSALPGNCPDCTMNEGP